MPCCWQSAWTVHHCANSRRFSDTRPGTVIRAAVGAVSCRPRQPLRHLVRLLSLGLVVIVTAAARLVTVALRLEHITPVLLLLPYALSTSRPSCYCRPTPWAHDARLVTVALRLEHITPVLLLLLPYALSTLRPSCYYCCPTPWAHYARLVTGTRRREHIMPVLRQLHWLPVQQRIEFKVLNGPSPQYFADDCQLTTTMGRQRLASSNFASCELAQVWTITHSLLLDCVCGSTYLPSTWLWTYSPGVALVTEDAPVFAKDSVTAFEHLIDYIYITLKWLWTQLVEHVCGSWSVSTY